MNTFPARLNLPRKQMWLHNFIIVTNSVSLFFPLTHSLLLSQNLVSDGRWSSARPLSVSISVLIPRASPFTLTSSLKTFGFVCTLSIPLSHHLWRPPPHSLPLSSSSLCHLCCVFTAFLFFLSYTCFVLLENVTNSASARTKLFSEWSFTIKSNHKCN